MKKVNKEIIDKNKNEYGWFAKSDILGSYDFYTTIVSLESIEEKHLDEIKVDLAHLKKVKRKKEKLRVSTYEKIKKIYPLAHHEYTHFIDSTSTLWGMKYLLEMKEAYIQNTKKFKSDETEFHKSKHFYNKVRTFRLPSYYTEITTNENKRPWKYKETCGNRFRSDGTVSDHPIFFVHFNNANDELLVRSPLSMISILESSAMAQELMIHLDLIASLPDGTKNVQSKLYDKDIMNLLYDHELTEYSVCCHLISNDQKYSGVKNSLKACALINRLILNFPSVYFDELSERSDLDKLLKIPSEEYIKRIKIALKYRDHGVLFFILSKLLPANSLENVPTINTGIEKALNKLGYSLDCIKAESEKEVSGIHDILTSYPQDIISIIAGSGLKNYKSIEWDVCRIPFEKLELPPACLGDLSEVVLLSRNIENKLSKLNLDDVLEELHQGTIWVKKISEACI